MKSTTIPGIAAAAVILTTFASSCMVEQEMVLQPDLSGTWSISGQAQAFAGTALDDLAILGGFDDAGALYDDAVSKAEDDLNRRDDIESFAIARTGAHAWSARLDFTDLQDVLGHEDAGGIVEYRTHGGVSTLRLVFDRESADTIGELVPLMDDPALSLFNPAATDGIDEESYITGILGFTFGEHHIPEIRLARIGLDLTLPGNVTEVLGGSSITSRSVRFETPFTRFLVPDHAIVWQVSWRNE